MPKTASYCIYETRHTRKECVVRGQCPACEAYQSGLFAPHFKPPTIITQNYVLDSCISPVTGLLVIWCVDGVFAF